jgi:hypothetical protein
MNTLSWPAARREIASVPAPPPRPGGAGVPLIGPA